MTDFKKVKDALSLVVLFATSIVALAEIWKEIEPKVKAALGPVFDACKEIASNDSNKMSVVIDN